MIAVYEFFLEQNLKSGFYNAGFENLKIINIAKIIQKKTKAKIKISKSNDPRSYRQDSSKLLKLGFKKKFSVENAINEIIDAYKNFNLRDKPINYTVKWMQKLKIK
jgi:nucleoside-diphosphate-sugar epimerase